MADNIQVLGQLNPSATTLSTLYTVPSSTQTTVSSLVVCNQDASDATFRVSVRVAGAGDDPKQYLLYDCPIRGNDTYIATIGMTLDTTDVVSVYASSASFSFNLFGVEVA